MPQITLASSQSSLLWLPALALGLLSLIMVLPPLCEIRLTRHAVKPCLVAGFLLAVALGLGNAAQVIREVSEGGGGGAREFFAFLAIISGALTASALFLILVAVSRVALDESTRLPVSRGSVSDLPE